MIHEIKVYDGNGVLKKTYDSKKATDMFWDSNEPITLNKRFSSKGAGTFKSVEVYENKKCPYCKKDFLAVGKMTFCTTTCQKKNWRDIARDKLQKTTLAKCSNARLVNGSMVFKIECGTCGIVLDMTSCAARFCSSECRDKSHRISYKEVKRKKDAASSKKRRKILKEKQLADELSKPTQTG